MKYKHLSMLAIASMSVLTLAACGDEEKEDSKKKDEKVTDEKVTDGVEKVDKKELSKNKKEILNHEGHKWFSTVDELRVVLKDNKVPVQEELTVIDYTDENNEKQSQNVLEATRFNLLGFENTNAFYYFSKTLNYNEPVDINDITKGYKISKIETDELVLSQIVYNISETDFESFMKVYKEKYGEPTISQENIALYANETTNVNIIGLTDGILSITITPTESTINSMSKTYKDFNQKALEGTVEKESEDKDEKVESKEETDKK